jgi:hypothetical protein
VTAFVVVDAGLTGCIDQDFGGEFNPGGSEAQNLSAITFAAGSLVLSRDLTGGYSSPLPLYRDGIAGRSHHYDAPTLNEASRRPVCADGSGDLNSLM